MIIRIAIILVLSLLLCSNTWAADVVENTASLFGPYGSKYERVQGIPREHVAPLATAGEVVVVMSYFASGTYENVKAFADYGATARDSFDLGSDIHNHLHLTRLGDVIYVVGNNYPAIGGLTYKEIHRVDVTDITNISRIGSAVTITDAGGVTDAVGAIAFYRDGDSLMCINRGPNAMNTDYVRSDDSGLTWEGSYSVAYAYDRITRMDLDPMGDSLSALIMDYNTVGISSFDWIMYDPGTGWTGFVEITADADFERLYSSVVGRDNTVHVSYMDDENPSHVLHAWRNPSGGAWTIDTVFTADQAVTGNVGLWTAMTFSKYASVTRIFYTINNGNTAEALWCRKWDYSTDSWEDDPLEVSNASATEVCNTGGCLDVPVTHLDRAYVTFMQLVGGNWSTVMVTVYDSEATEYTGEEGAVTNQIGAVKLGNVKL